MATDRQAGLPVGGGGGGGGSGDVTPVGDRRDGTI